MPDVYMIDLSKRYYAVHVDARDNYLQGIHYIPFSDEDIERMKQDYEREKGQYWFYFGTFLRNFMKKYCRSKFAYEIDRDGSFSALVDGSFEPIDMQAIIDSPSLFWYDENTPIYRN